MKLKTLVLTTSLVATFSQFESTSHASNTVPDLPDEMILEIFSHLEPHEVGSKTSVSKQFNRVACDSKSPFGKIKNAPGGEDLYRFCRAQVFEEGQVLALARRVLAMTSNPIPEIISQEEFEKAKEYATDVISYDK